MNCLVPTAVSSLCVLLSLACSRMPLLLVLNCADMQHRKAKCLLEITASMHGNGDGKERVFKTPEGRNGLLGKKEFAKTSSLLMAV